MMLRSISLLALLLPLTVLADTLTGKVVKITDGDTVHVQVATTRHMVRLAGIDAPERDQQYGAESMRISADSDHRFRAKTTGDFAGSRPLISHEDDHRFR